MQKEWKEYVKVWIENHPNSKLRSVRQRASSDGAPVQEGNRSGNAPSPPILPAENTPKTPSDASRSISPNLGTPSRPNTKSYQETTAFEQKSEDLQTLSERIILSQAALDQSLNSGPVDLSETSDETDGRQRLLGLSIRPSDILSLDQNTDASQGLESVDEYPIVVSERSLKRKRVSVKKEADIQVYADDCVKLEPLSSSPAPFISSRHMGVVQDSLDLEDFGDKLHTPKKRQRVEQTRFRSLMAEGSREEYPDDTPGALESRDKKLSRSSSASKDNMNNQVAPTAMHVDILNSLFPDDAAYDLDISKEQQLKKERKDASIRLQNVHNDRIHAGPGSLTNRSTYPVPATANTKQASTPQYQRDNGPLQGNISNPLILRPTDPNALPRTSERLPHKNYWRSTSRGDRGAAHVQALAEDGEETTPSRKMPGSINGPDTSNGRRTAPGAAEQEHARVPDAYRRLGVLLTGQAVEKTPIPSIKPRLKMNKSVRFSKTPTVLQTLDINGERPITPRKMPAQGRPKATVETESRSAEPTLKRPIAGMSKRTPFLNPNPLDIDPEDEPLRARPVQSLSLGHFRLNPNHSEYVYHESIRKHDEKKMIHGCVDPFCPRCKDVSRFVEQSGYTAPPKSGLFDSSPPDAEEADRRLLEEYLSSNRGALKRMSKEERQSLLSKAKTKQFQDQFGKHRQAHTRAKSPPGYWNADFPTTQEDQENRAAASLMEREKVEERYREALRGGMWKFADE